MSPDVPPFAKGGAGGIYLYTTPAAPVPSLSSGGHPKRAMRRVNRNIGNKKAPGNTTGTFFLRHVFICRPAYSACRFTHGTYRSIHPCRNFTVSGLAMFPSPSKKPSFTWMNTSGCPMVGTSR